MKGRKRGRKAARGEFWWNVAGKVDLRQVVQDIPYQSMKFEFCFIGNGEP